MSLKARSSSRQNSLGPYWACCPPRGWDSWSGHSRSVSGGGGYPRSGWTGVRTASACRGQRGHSASRTRLTCGLRPPPGNRREAAVYPLPRSEISPLPLPAGLFSFRGGPIGSAWSLPSLSLAVRADRPCRRVRKQGFVNARPWRKAAASRTHSKEAFSNPNGPGCSPRRGSPKHTHVA